MTNLLSQLKEVEELVKCKHLPGQHDQGTHAGGVPHRTPEEHLSKLQQAVAADKKVKKHKRALSSKLDGVKFKPGIGGRHPIAELKGDVRGEVHSTVTGEGFKHQGGDSPKYMHVDGTSAEMDYDRHANNTRLTLIPAGSVVYD